MVERVTSHQDTALFFSGGFVYCCSDCLGIHLEGAYE
jgi:hypothetical protein